MTPSKVAEMFLGTPREEYLGWFKRSVGYQGCPNIGIEVVRESSYMDPRAGRRSRVPRGTRNEHAIRLAGARDRGVRGLRPH